MPKADLQTRGGGAGAKPPGPSAVGDDFGHGLEELFGEIAWLGNRLKRASALSEGQADRSAGERSVLRILGRNGPQTVPQMARVRGTSRQSVQALVNRLAAEGRVTLGSNPAHKRSALVRLTERGQALQASLAESEARFLESLAPHVTVAGLLAAVAALVRLRQQIGDQEQVEARREVRKAPRKREKREGEKRKAENEKAETIAAVTAENERPQPTPAPPEEEQENQLPVNLL